MDECPGCWKYTQDNNVDIRAFWCVPKLFCPQNIFQSIFLIWLWFLIWFLITYKICRHNSVFFSCIILPCCKVWCNEMKDLDLEPCRHEAYAITDMALTCKSLPMTDTTTWEATAHIRIISTSRAVFITLLCILIPIYKVSRMIRNNISCVIRNLD